MNAQAGQPESPGIVPAAHSGIYRQLVSDRRLSRYRVRVDQSDLLIATQGNFSRQAHRALLEARGMILKYGSAHPGFIKTLTPLPGDPAAAPVVADMLGASSAAGVGPMAAVAGAVAQYVGEALLGFSSEVIVENGGDIYLNGRTSRRICILAETAESPCLTIEVPPIAPAGGGMGVCTSSGRLGPSLSLGRADAVTALAPRAALADALATALANRVREPADITPAMALARQIGALGVVIVLGGHIGAWGALRFVDYSGSESSG